jgi:hypothetical protein
VPDKNGGHGRFDPGLISVRLPATPVYGLIHLKRSMVREGFGNLFRTIVLVSANVLISDFHERGAPISLSDRKTLTFRHRHLTIPAPYHLVTAGVRALQQPFLDPLDSSRPRRAQCSQKCLLELSKWWGWFKLLNLGTAPSIDNNIPIRRLVGLPTPRIA